MEYRIEKDTMGEIEVPKEKLWGAQTERSRRNFTEGHKMPIEIIRAFALLKKSAALANRDLGVLTDEKAEQISMVCDEILEGVHDEEFPLVVYQTGSGTHTNMNINEVIANRAGAVYSEKILHPNDDVNRSQSSNDTFPTAMSIAATVAIEDELLPSVDDAISTLTMLEGKYARTVKTGRTHLQDAVPMTFGQEVSGWRSMLEHCSEGIRTALPHIKEIALGGTAVGTGLNAPEGFAAAAVDNLNKLTDKNFVSAPNKFHALSSKDMYVRMHGALQALAADMMKIANDVRWLASGPRCGLGEIELPANEPGSSIMPGKVNPTQAEAMTMIALRVMGNDTVIGVAASQGNFELNVYMPLIADTLLESVRLLAGGIRSFEQKCLRGISANEDKMRENAEKSLMVAAALNTHIGYEKAAAAAKKAHAEGLPLKAAGVNLGLFTAEEYNEWVDLYELTHSV